MAEATTDGQPGRDDGVAALMAATARALQAEPDLDRTLQAIATATLDAVPVIEHAGVFLIQDGVLRTVAYTSDLVLAAHKLQERFAEGPCFDAVKDKHDYRTDDLATETRWPSFTRGALDLGVRSMLAFRLFVSGRTLGALNLYSEEAHDLDVESSRIAGLFAAHAAIALAGSHQEAQLLQALNSRDIIGQAKGILSIRHTITGEQAFQLLVESSQRANVKLRVLAARIVAAADQEAMARSGRPDPRPTVRPES